MNTIYADVHDGCVCAACGAEWDGKNPTLLVFRTCGHYDALCNECAFVVMTRAFTEITRGVAP